jgi:UDP-N-acetylmuramoyl-tripeptide--D-alanyl-D-alanine ligase
VTAHAFWTLTRAADALRALEVVPSPRGHTVLPRVSTDTRTIAKGDLFVALNGENFDGHDFLAQAVASAASAVVVTDPRRGTGLGVPVFAVTNTTHALGALGRYRRTVWAKPVVAVGGSNGKTSTKELVRAALDSRLDVHATQGNLNNQIGVPQTLLALPDHADIAVVEVGTNEPGEIAILRQIAVPTIAIVTAIQEEHLEGFRDLAGVLREESDLLDGVELAIVPALETALIAEARKRARRVVTVGIGEGDLSAEDCTIAADGTSQLFVEGVAVKVPLRGAHNARNAMLALAAAQACGLSLEDAARGISGLDPAGMPGMRSAVEPLGDALLVNDAYNANPGSARAALGLLSAVAGGRPRVVVLGTMRELGAASAQSHRDIAKAAVDSGAAIVAGIGEFAVALREVAAGHRSVITADDVDDLWAVLEPRLPVDAAILLKASRGVRLERIVPPLRAWATDPSPYRTG